MRTLSAAAGRSGIGGARRSIGQPLVRRQFVEERMLQGLGCNGINFIREVSLRQKKNNWPVKRTHCDPLRRVIVKHLLDEIEQLQMVVALRLQIAHQRFAVVTHIVAGRRFLVPVQFAVVKVLGLGFAEKSMVTVWVSRTNGRDIVMPGAMTEGVPIGNKFDVTNKGINQ